ncbi:MAG: carbohydrate ABC transporter substrate-binding protein [Alphaproteobacteria bacterium]
MSAAFSGLTWDHPRGYDALAAAAAMASAGHARPLVQWDRQPLEGFESAPIGELAARHDLLVLDHPHIGEAAALDCLQPLEALYPADRIAAWRRQSVGAALDSYVWAGRTWALPLDVAMQVCARRPDRVADAPGDWDAVVRLAERLPVAISVAGPHPLLMLFAIAAGHGALPGGDDLLDDRVATDALALMHRLHKLAPSGTASLNPIALLEAMATGDAIALVPLVFGYVTYAMPGTRAHALGFTDAPRVSGSGRRGSVLGGTGIGITRRAVPDAALLAHLAWLMDPRTQTAFVPAHGGQPSARDAWTDAGVNAACGGFYRDTLATAETALVRPRFDGYVAFQSRAGERIRRALAAAEPAAVTLAGLRDDWRHARAAARGDLDDTRSIR